MSELAEGQVLNWDPVWSWVSLERLVLCQCSRRAFQKAHSPSADTFTQIPKTGERQGQRNFFFFLISSLLAWLPEWLQTPSWKKVQPTFCRVTIALKCGPPKGHHSLLSQEYSPSGSFGRTWAGPRPWHWLRRLSPHRCWHELWNGPIWNLYSSLLLWQSQAHISSSLHPFLEEKETNLWETSPSASNQLLKVVRWESGRARKRSRLDSAKCSLPLPIPRSEHRQAVQSPALLQAPHLPGGSFPV